MTTDTASPSRLTARERALRRDRIFTRLLDGQSATTIAAEEGVTPRRVHQMVREALDRWDADPKQDHANLQIARLETALRLIEAKIDEGDVSVIDKFIKVLGLLEKYHSTPLHEAETMDAGDREKVFVNWTERLAMNRDAVAARFAASKRARAQAEATAADALDAGAAKTEAAGREIVAVEQTQSPPVQNPPAPQIPVLRTIELVRIPG